MLRKTLLVQNTSASLERTLTAEAHVATGQILLKY
jgi:hypothetical protein